MTSKSKPSPVVSTPTLADPLSDLQSRSISPFDPWQRTIRPLGVYALHGLIWANDYFLAIDTVRGYLLRIDPQSDNSTILNPYHVDYFLDATGLAIQGDTLWFTHNEGVYMVDNPLTKPWDTPPNVDRSFTPEATAARIAVEAAAAPDTPITPTPLHPSVQMPPPTPALFTRLPYPANGIAICGSTVYVACQKAGYILVYDAESRQLITKLPAPGVGVESLTIRDEELWVCDSIEQTVYCVDRATGEVQFSVLTPFPNPTGLAFCAHPETGESLLYITYANEEAYIRDNPNAEDPRELAVRDRTFIHPLYFRHFPKPHYSLSTGYRVEMSYVEELSPLDAVYLEDVEWRIALPSNTARQRVLQVEPIGLPFTEEEQNGQRVAVFRFNALTPHEGRLFGWKAVLEVWSIKYDLTPDDAEVAGRGHTIPVAEFAEYLKDDGSLAMDTPAIQAAAREAIGTETNVLRKMLKIRNYVYDRLILSCNAASVPVANMLACCWLCRG